MGSQSDWETMENTANILDEFSINYEVKIVSAHRTPDRLYKYEKTTNIVVGYLISNFFW